MKTDKLFQDHGYEDIIARQNEYLKNLTSNIQEYSQSHPLNNRPPTFSNSNKWNRHFKQENVKREADDNSNSEEGVDTVTQAQVGQGLELVRRAKETL